MSLTNAHTRRAYARACRSFFQWCGHRGLRIETIRPHDVSAYVQTMSSELSPQSVRQSLAAIRMLFDWLVDGRIGPREPWEFGSRSEYRSNPRIEPASDGLLADV